MTLKVPFSLLSAAKADGLLSGLWWDQLWLAAALGLQ